jgi:excisionase family DNA binding protein
MTTPRLPLPLFLNVREAAEMLGVSTERLSRALKTAQIPSVQVGARRLIARATLEKLAALDPKDAA